MDSGNKESHASKVQFKHFDVVPEAKDHFFSSSRNGKNPDYAKVMREWKILQDNLPEDIYVQVYETRIDLLRAVIIGASGTPYHDGLFFFDILLPSNYPEQPPSVYYHSCGYRLNPNLYDSGYVCLSLINTWQGSQNEMWQRSSSILQVLVSIQGLVLNERPYFNEPHYGKFITSPSYNKASYEYSENAFILSCQTMLHIMKKPPINFEDFVAQHFRLRAASILTAILDYQKGNMLVGQFDQLNGSSSSGVKVSNEFRTTLTKIYSIFKTAFDNVIPKADMEKIEKMKNEEGEGSSSVKVSNEFRTDLTKICSEFKTTSGSVICEAGIKKVEKMKKTEEGEGSSSVKISNEFRTGSMKICSELKKASDNAISEAGIEKIEKMKKNEDGEGSSSSSKIKKRVKKWRLLKYASSKRKGKEKMEQNKDGIWNRIVSFAKRILK